MSHTVDKVAIVEITNEKINSACSVLSNMFDGGLNVTQGDTERTRQIIDKLRDAQSELLSLLKTL
jgi:hypothetical protein